MVAGVDGDGGHAAHVHCETALIDLRAQAVDEALGRAVLGCALRDHGHHSGVAGRVDVDGGNEGDVGIAPNGGRKGADAALVGGPGEVGRQQNGPVEAGTEPLGQQVVGPPGGQRRRVVALVGHPEADREHRNGDGHQDHEAEDRHERRSLLDLTAPPERR